MDQEKEVWGKGVSEGAEGERETLRTFRKYYISYPSGVVSHLSTSECDSCQLSEVVVRPSSLDSREERDTGEEAELRENGGRESGTRQGERKDFVHVMKN